MKEVSVPVTKYKAEVDGSIFETQSEALMYEVNYEALSFKVDLELLKKWKPENWKHFKYHFFRNYAVARHLGNGGYYPNPVHCSFYQSINSADELLKCIKDAMYGDRPKTMPGSMPRRYKKNSGNGYLCIKYFGKNKKGFSFSDSSYFVHNSINWHYNFLEYMYVDPSATIDTGMGMYSFVPSQKSLFEFCEFVFDSGMFKVKDFIFFIVMNTYNNQKENFEVLEKYKIKMPKLFLGSFRGKDGYLEDDMDQKKFKILYDRSLDSFYVTRILDILPETYFFEKENFLGRKERKSSVTFKLLNPDTKNSDWGYADKLVEFGIDSFKINPKFKKDFITIFNYCKKHSRNGKVVFMSEYQFSDTKPTVVKFKLKSLEDLLTKSFKWNTIYEIE